ncbi:glycosyltransferase family 2 protein [Nitratireductor sp. GISD-1A_MAKvit]|uniref:glycosyltransferase family 2 protein n=1 Tax=Nitratireductor sp. GISD-1A_MAKvit TaxID=3234198 RepID=UPI00346517B9
MATYNGAEFLDEQLASIANQDWPHIDLWVSDDGSTDGTRACLERWQRQWVKGSFFILEGPQQGYVENFRSLMANDAVEGAFVAFSDQDDVWDADKLSCAVRKLDEAGGGQSAMYCGRTRLVDRFGAECGFSPLFVRKPCFENAIVQSIGGGNTIVLNAAAHNLVRASALRTSFVSHDWWCYQIVSGAGGLVIYDPQAHIAYRQHGGNLIGENQGWRARRKRLVALAEGRFAGWNSVNIAALEQCGDLLNDEGRRVLAGFRAVREAMLLRGTSRLWQCGIHRQSLPSNIALYLAAFVGKL